MSFFDDVVNVVKTVVENATGMVGTAVAQITAAFAQIGYTLVDFIDQLTLQIQDALSDVLPDEVAQWVGLSWFLVETAAFYGVAFLQNFSNAVRTGKFGDILDVVTPAVVIAIRLARNEARHNALRIPQEIVALIPDRKDRNYVLDAVRYTTIKRIDDKKFFYVWSKFKGDIKGITLLDTICLVEPPDFQDANTIFLLLHEIKHSLQFRDIGEDKFMQQYLLEKITKHDPPSFEIEADKYACSIRPNGNPSYISDCP